MTQEFAMAANTRRRYDVGTILALACEDRIWVEVNRWNGWSKQGSSEAYFSNSSNLACFPSTSDWRAKMAMRFITDQSHSAGATLDGFGSSVGNSAPAWSGWFYSTTGSYVATTSGC